MRNNNNIATITGQILSEVIFNHEIYGEKFYSAIISAMRSSGHIDNIPVLISEKLLSRDIYGKNVRVTGSYRQRNMVVDGERSKMQLYVFADSVSITDADYSENAIELEGFLCKDAKFRVTPMEREIADLLLAVNRPYGKSDYIPCIAWGRNAKFADTLSVGTKVRIAGRIQSRIYIKKYDDHQEERTAYEVSITSMEVVE